MITEQARAKINLYLHVTGKRGDGYHLLDSLVCFADYGDEVRVEAADDYELLIDGPFAGGFSAAEKGAQNIVTRAVYGLAEVLGRAPSVRVYLTKNLPLAAGIGGGSADAAAVVRALLRLWDVGAQQVPGLEDLLLRLGADVPVCFYGRAALMRGIGEELSPVADLPEMAAVLVNPLLGCSTAGIFAKIAPPFADNVERVGAWDGFLQEQRNDLSAAACGLLPEIAVMLDLLRAQDGCAWARMSGSGASCFGIYEDVAAAQEAAAIIAEAQPGWWVRPVLLNAMQD